MKTRILFHYQFCLIIIFISLPVILFSQQKKYSSSNKSAIKHYEKGVHALDIKQLDEAMHELSQAIDKDSNFVEAYILKASIYEDIKMPAEAINQYVKSFQTNPDFFSFNYYRCAQLELKLGYYQEALVHFKKYVGYPNIAADKKKNTEKYIADCNFAIEAVKNPVEFVPKNLGKTINTNDGEYYFNFTVDQQTLIFTRDISDKQAMFGHQEDFFMSKLKEGKWTQAEHLSAPINSMENEGAPTLSADGRAVFFTACNKSDGKGSCDLYLSQLKGDFSWSKPVNLGSPVNTSLFESQPSFSSDGKTLFFSRRVKTLSRKDHTDIFYAVLQNDMTWSEPKSLGDNVNTSGNEESVFIHPDNQTLYFSSEGHPGMGGLDIYISRRQADGEWGEAKNLGYPINTNNDENSFVVSADGLHAYFASDRPGGFGKLDIYVFDLYKEARPLLTSYVKGKVYDAVTNLPLAAEFEIIDVESGKVIFSNTTDKLKGEFLACLPAGKSYMLNVSKTAYLFYSENFECRKKLEKQEAFLLNISLRKPTVGETVILKNIFFDVNKFDLKPESTAELNKLIIFLADNKFVKIEIGGHTDNSGDKKNNLTLSSNRAKAVYDYLITNGKITAARMICVINIKRYTARSG